MRGSVLFDVDNIPISGILRSLFTQEGTFRSGLRGGEAAPAPVEYRSAVPGGLLKAAGATGSTPRREAVSLPALDYAGAVSESALRRDGEGRSPMDPLRVTGSVGRGVRSLRLCGRWVFVRAGRQGHSSRRGWMEHLPPGTGRTPPLGTEETCPGERRGNLPRGIGGVTAPMPVGPFAPESKTGVPKIAERGAPGRHPSLTKAPTARRSAPPVSICRKTRAKAAGTRNCVSIQPSNSPPPPSSRPERSAEPGSQRGGSEPRSRVISGMTERGWDE